MHDLNTGLVVYLTLTFVYLIIWVIYDTARAKNEARERTQKNHKRDKEKSFWSVRSLQ